MIAKAKGRYIRMAPRKVRAVTRLIKDRDVQEAQVLLAHLPKAAAKPVAKVLKSAVANATRSGTWTEDQLKVSKIMADQGPIMKRYRAASMGRAARIKKYTSHLTIELDVKG